MQRQVGGSGRKRLPKLHKPWFFEYGRSIGRSGQKTRGDARPIIIGLPKGHLPMPPEVGLSDDDRFQGFQHVPNCYSRVALHFLKPRRWGTHWTLPPPPGGGGGLGLEPTPQRPPRSPNLKKNLVPQNLAQENS